jgi:flagellar hook assembly protein FlgD
MDRTQGAGVHMIEWNGDDELGRQVATGVYIYHLTAGSHVALKKMTFSK